MEQPKILIVDDEEELLSMYKTKFTKSGFTVLEAHNGEEGVRLATQEQPDLVLMDEKMPVMDGITAQRMLRQNPQTKDLKVVFLTAFSNPERPEQLGTALAKQDGMLGFIKKGTSLDDLVKKVRKYLETPPAMQPPVLTGDH